MPDEEVKAEEAVVEPTTEPTPETPAEPTPEPETPAAPENPEATA